MEEMTVEVAVTGDYATASPHVTLNPLVTCGDAARAVLNEMLEELIAKKNRSYLYDFIT